MHGAADQGAGGRYPACAVSRRRTRILEALKAALGGAVSDDLLVAVGPSTPGTLRVQIARLRDEVGPGLTIVRCNGYGYRLCAA